MSSSIKCVVDGCSFETTTLRDEDKMMKLLEWHIKLAHPVDSSSSSGEKSSGKEKIKRPMLSMDITEDDWSYWTNRINDYLKMTKTTDDEALTEIKECLEEELRRELHRQHPQGFLDKNLMMEGLKKLVVKQRNRAVVRDELHRLVQDRGEGVRRFSGRIQALANVGEYVHECSHCKKSTTYKDEVVKDQIIPGD